MIIGFLTAVAGSALTSAAVIQAVSSGVGLGISVYVASKGVRRSSGRGHK